jgi:hypothetical protein
MQRPNPAPSRGLGATGPLALQNARDKPHEWEHASTAPYSLGAQSASATHNTGPAARDGRKSHPQGPMPLRGEVSPL